MADFYKDMQNLASSLITEFNQGACEYVDIQPGNGPVDNPGPAVEVIHPTPAVARGVQFRYINNTDIVSTDLQMTIPVKDGMMPKMSGFVRGDGQRYKIVGVRTIPPFGTPVAHVIIFRK